MHDLNVSKLLISALLTAILLVTAVSCVDDEPGETVQPSRSDSSYASSADVSNESSADTAVSSPYQEIIDDLEELERIINELDDLTPDDLEVPEP